MVCLRDHEDGTSVLNMRPEDYIKAGAPEESKAWNVIRKMPFPRVVEPPWSPEELCRADLVFVCAWLADMLGTLLKHEVQVRTEWLYSGVEPFDLDAVSMARSMAREAGRY